MHSNNKYVAMSGTPSSLTAIDEKTDNSPIHEPNIMPVIKSNAGQFDEFELNATPSNGLIQNSYSRISYPSLTVERSMHSSIMSSFMTFVEHERVHKTSIYGPLDRTKFMIVIFIMTFCGSNNDFLGKLCYQSLPEHSYDWYWIVWILTAATFLICAVGIIFGWDHGVQWNKFKENKKEFLINISIAGTCDVFVNLGRYVGLVFLDASVVTILKCGLQLIFSAVFRLLFEGKTLSIINSVGIGFVIIGLALVCVCSFLAVSDDLNTLIGIVILISVGLFGSIRNSFEQILCRDNGYNSYFIVGVRSIVSLLWVILIAMLLLCLPLYHDTKTGWNGTDIYDKGIKYIFEYPLFIICLILFMLAIYGKNVTQMKIIELSSALTRNLTMQFTPVFTWILSLFVYYAVSHSVGEEWTQYSYIRMIGFVIVLIGSYLYMRIPPKQPQES